MQPFLHVSPEKSSEKNLATSVMGVLSDYMPRNQYRTCGPTEQVFCVRFEECDANKCSLAYSIILSLVTCKGSYIWGISFGGNATLLYAERNTCTIDLKLLPTPTHPGDSLFSSRPLMAICDTFSCLSYQWQVRFISLCDHRVVLSYSLESKALSVDANDRFVVVNRTDAITVFSALTLTECYTIAYVKPILWSNLVPKNVPSSLGIRWLAFADSKPVYQHLSRCGDASTDESQPLTTAVLSMNKRLWDGISALATSVVSNSLSANCPTSRVNHLSPQHQPPQSPSPEAFQRYKLSLSSSELNDSNTTISPGYVTIVDLQALKSEHELLRKLEKNTTSMRLYSNNSNLCSPPVQPNTTTTSSQPQYCSTNNERANIITSGTKYLNVHEFSGSGALVAHFMAHRWANVALLKFDTSGSLLFTACKRGHSFNLFRIANHPFDQRQTAVHHLYILERGNLPCEAGSVKHPCVLHVQSYGSVSGTSGTVASSCQTAPIAGFAPQCPHLGFTSAVTPFEENPLGYINEQCSNTTCVVDSDPTLSGTSPLKSSFTSASSFSSETSSQLHIPGSRSYVPDQSNMLFANSEGLCACPPNALYNSTNSRLPPYPEPCRVKAEARLKPSSGNTITSVALDAAGSALEAVTPMTGTSTSLIDRSSSSVKPYCCSSNGAHYSDVCTHTQIPIASATRSALHSRKHNRRQRGCQSLQSVDQDISSPTSSSVRAARFGPPVCFLPNQFRLNNISSDYCSDPYVGKSRAVDALFILTADLRLIEYDLCVSPADTATIGGKLYQDGSIRLDCVPVGEWNLHTDAVYLPPFPKQHPLILASSTLQSRCKVNKSKCDRSPTISSDPTEIRCEPYTNSPSPASLVHHEKPVSPLKPVSLQNIDNSNRKTGLLKVQTSTIEGDDNRVVTPAGWTAEDVASYWYSQVEITTHLGPLRRVWMGPQFTFRNYSKQREWSRCDLRLSSLSSSENDSLSISSQTVGFGGHITTALHPTLLEAFTLNTPSILPPILDITDTSYNELLLKDRFPATLTPLNGSNNSLNMIAYHSSSVSSSSSTITTSSSVHHAFIHSHLSHHHPNMTLTAMSRNTPPSKTIMLPRLPSGLILDSSTGYNSAQLRWRNSSGEPTRPLSITGGFGPTGEPIIIEGGSYQNSSLGSSLSSLVGRGTDDLAQSIAEAIQDEETNWNYDKSPSSVQQASTVGNRGVWQFSVKSTVSSGTIGSTIFRPSTIPAQSILSEADFPSQDTSPSAVDNISSKYESSEQIVIDKHYKNENQLPKSNLIVKNVRRKHGKKLKARRCHSSTIEELNPSNLYPSGYESLSTSPIVEDNLVYYKSSSVLAHSLPDDLKVSMFIDNNDVHAPDYNDAINVPSQLTQPVDDENTNRSNETFQSEETDNNE
ncbi:unnamed protein product [Heterobilharzia americana]|nr:unnamed protein product [Heterobilharzia americana]